MGYGRFDRDTYRSYAASSGIAKARSASEIYTSSTVKECYLPKLVNRESCDSAEHPESTPIAIGLDVTGSMSRIIQLVAQTLGDMMDGLYKGGKVTDPQVLFAAIDDYISTSTPLQVTQFESDIRIAEQLKELKFISRGGGNGWESYVLFWYFCARHTKLDCVTKHGKKGFLFTMGDDGYQKSISPDELRDVFGDESTEGISTKALYDELCKKYEVFHICLSEGSTYRDRDFRDYQSLMGSHAIRLDHYEMLPEVITSVIRLYQGDTKTAILADIDKEKLSTIEQILNNVKPDADLELI